MGGVKIARSHIDQSCFAGSIGEVCICRQNGWCQNRSVTHRSVKCVIVVKKRGRWVVSKSLGRTSIGEVRNRRQKQGVSSKGDAL